VEPFLRLVDGLNRSRVRYLLIGVAGANQYAVTADALFTTRDFDLFLATSSENLLKAGRVCEAVGLQLFSHDEPLDTPRDLDLARRVAKQRAVVRGDDGRGLQVDLTIVMAGQRFDAVWRRRRRFRIEGVQVPVAPLEAIVASKAAADRPKDRLFLATHEEALRQLLGRESGRTTRPRTRPRPGRRRPGR
jgi:hypothetical protein